MRVWEVLNGPAKEFLKEPARLKFLLAPVLTKSAAEQARFYEIFDLWWNDMQAPLPMPPRKRWWKYIPPAIWLLLGALAALWMGYLIYKIKIKSAAVEGILFISQESGVAVGDTFSFTSHFENADPLNYRLEWHVQDSTNAVNPIERRDTSRHWTFVWNTLSGSYDKTIRLFAYPHNGQDTLDADLFVRLYCASPPEIKDIVIQKDKSDAQLIAFKAEAVDRKGYSYEWDFGDGNKGKGISAKHRYDKNIRYTATLTVRDTTAAGWCESAFSKSVDIGREKAYLPEFPLYEDTYSATAVFSWGAWIAMALLALTLLFFWVKWALRETPKPPPPPQAPKLESTDRAPYFIPWRNQDGHIRPSREQYRLADALRLRQEGLVRLVDVPATVKATINKGGFPEFRFRYNTRPTDYLMLVDEQTHLSHQTRLFQYLAGQLRSQDVHLDIFYYDTDFHRFWNQAYPTGVSLDVLHRLYPEHRLVVMGNAHALLDPYATERPRLRADYEAGFRPWRHRLLLTPLPPRSWTFREGILYQFFALFPADIRGLGDAATYVEAGLETEDLPLVYTQWESIQQNRRQEGDLNYRRWRTLQDHEEYLEGYPQLLTWLRALAVYPTPTWEITLAIGKALAPKGIVVSYDNLLRLSRIPWMQTGRLDPRLREEMLEDLDPEAEKLARQAVKEELQAVIDNTRNGHANLEAQSNLAIQQFAINPDDKAYQDAIRYMLEKGILNKKQEAELNQVVGRHTSYTGAMTTKGGDYPMKRSAGEDLQTFLSKNIADSPPPPLAQKRPFFTSDFWWASGLLALFLILLALMRGLSGTDALCASVFGECATDPDSLRHAFFVKETLKIDSAVVYNNMGVQQWDETKDTSAVSLFRKAVAIRKAPYALAYENWNKVYYDAAQQQYQAFLEDSLDIAALPGVQQLFRQATRPPANYTNELAEVNLEALHGVGLIHYYLDRRDSAAAYYNLLLNRTDSSFFENLRYAPNLETLLGIKTSRILDVRILEGRNGELPVVVDYYYDPSQYRDLRLDLAPLDANGAVPRGFNIAAITIRPGQGTDTLVLRRPQQPSDNIQTDVITSDQIKKLPTRPQRQSGNIQTDSLRIRLITPATRTAVAQRVIAHAQTWQEEKIAPNNISTPKSQRLNLNITLQDETTKQPIRFADARVEYTLANETRRQSALIMRNSDFRIETAEKSPPDLMLFVEVRDYRPYSARVSSKDWLTGRIVVGLTPIRQEPILPEPIMSKLTVTVYRENNQPEYNVNLVLFKQAEGGQLEQIAQKNTGRESNRAEFMSVPAGNYTITADKAGFEPGSANFVLDQPEYNLNLTMAQAAQNIPRQYPPLTLYFDHRSPEKAARSDYESEYNYFSIKQKDYLSYRDKLNASQANRGELLSRFFRDDLQRGYNDFNNLLKTLSDELSQGIQIEISLAGYSDISEGRESVARRIAENRVETIENAITNYNKRELRKYIQNGSLIITKQPVNNPQSAVNGPEDPNAPSVAYDPATMKLRKVEISISTLFNPEIKKKD